MGRGLPMAAPRSPPDLQMTAAKCFVRPYLANLKRKQRANRSGAMGKARNEGWVNERDVTDRDK